MERESCASQALKIDVPYNNKRKEFCWQSCGAFGLVHGCPLTSFSSTAVAVLCRCRVVFGNRSLLVGCRAGL